MAGRIVTYGWSAWTLAVNEVVPVRVGSVLYALFWPRGWVVIPLNAALAATAALALFKIVVTVTGERRLAVLGVLPFILFPSNLTWSTQMLSDGFSICGVMLLMLGWVQASGGRQGGRRALLVAAVLVLIGAFVSGARGVNAQAMLAATALGTMLLTTAALVEVSRGRGARHALASVACAWCAVALIVPFSGGGRPIDSDALPLPANAAPVQEDTWSQARSGLSDSSPDRLTSFWHASPVLPERLDAALHAMALSRAGFLLIYPEAASNVDLDRRPDDAQSVIAYLPRAAQVGFLAPFPRHWFERGRWTSTTVGRRLSAIEMMMVYGALGLLPVAAWRFRKNALLWSVMTACASLIVLLGFVVANVGALHRMRYPYLATFCALALTAGLTAAADAVGRPPAQPASSPAG
jgi:hypothetical protein